jgi:hypothetical protein
MALKSFQLFLSQVQSAPEDLKVRVLEVVFDILMVYQQEFFGRSQEIVCFFSVLLLNPRYLFPVGQPSRHVSPTDARE